MLGCFWRRLEILTLARSLPPINAQTKLGDISSDTSRSVKLEKDLREKNAMIGKLRHEGG